MTEMGASYELMEQYVLYLYTRNARRATNGPEVGNANYCRLLLLLWMLPWE